MTSPGGGTTSLDASGDGVSGSKAEVIEAPAAIDVGEPPGVPGPGCADGTREGFRNAALYPNIAGCAGGFGQAGVIGWPELMPACGNQAGDTSDNPAGRNCNAADLCAAQWHICRNGGDVARNHPSGSCEGCVPADEPRFFLVASGAAVSEADQELDAGEELDADESPIASSIGICPPAADDVVVRNATNDLHGCGGLGEPESPACAPLLRRMSFADCSATGGVWWCGNESDRLREAVVVTKAGPTMGGVLCCKN